MPVIAVLPQTLWPWMFSCSLQKPKGHVTVVNVVGVHGQLIISGPLSHTPVFSPSAKQENQLQDL